MIESQSLHVGYHRRVACEKLPHLAILDRDVEDRESIAPARVRGRES